LSRVPVPPPSRMTRPPGIASATATHSPLGSEGRPPDARTRSTASRASSPSRTCRRGTHPARGCSSRRCRARKSRRTPPTARSATARRR
jgi:hypothetical protein